MFKEKKKKGTVAGVRRNSLRLPPAGWSGWVKSGVRLTALVSTDRKLDTMGASADLCTADALSGVKVVPKEHRLWRCDCTRGRRRGDCNDSRLYYTSERDAQTMEHTRTASPREQHWEWEEKRKALGLSNTIDRDHNWR